MSIRTVQDVFDLERKNDSDIEEQQEEIECAQKLLEKYLEKRKSIENKLQSLKINLIEEQKIKFINCDMNTWREYNDDNMLCEKYYIYYYDGGIRQEGYYEGLSQLEGTDREHFDEFINDYLYYGYPLYIDRNHYNSEATECELAFVSGDAYFKECKY
jgi:hypothetical protein